MQITYQVKFNNGLPYQMQQMEITLDDTDVFGDNSPVPVTEKALIMQDILMHQCAVFRYAHKDMTQQQFAEITAARKALFGSLKNRAWANEDKQTDSA